MSSNQLLIESKIQAFNSKITNLKFLKADSTEMLSTNSALNFHHKPPTLDYNTRPLLKSRIKLQRSFKKSSPPKSDFTNENIIESDKPEIPGFNLLAGTGLGNQQPIMSTNRQQTRQKNESPKPSPKQSTSPNKLNTIRKSNLSRNKTVSYSQTKTFDSVIDGRSLNDSKQTNYQNPSISSFTSETQNRFSSDINSYLPNIYVNSSSSNYYTINNNKQLISELKEHGKKEMPLNENSIRRIRKLLNLDHMPSIEHSSRPKVSNRPKLKTPPLFHSNMSEKVDKNDLVLNITNIKPSRYLNSVTIPKRKISDVPKGHSSFSTGDNEDVHERKYSSSDYYNINYFDVEDADIHEYDQPIRIVFSDKAPPSSPQQLYDSIEESNDEPCSCLLCEKEVMLREKIKQQLLKNKQMKNSESFKASDSIVFELTEIDKAIAEALSNNMQYSSSHQINPVTTKKFI